MNRGIETRGLTRTFGPSKALDGVSFALPMKGLVGVLGPSGCGKSTLLNILSGMDVGFSGSVQVLGKNLGRMSDAKRRRFRLQNIGYVFQNFRLLELESAEMNVMLAMDAVYEGKKEWKRQKVRDLLTYFGVERKAKQKTNTLSGGEKQRVALARALANDPKILLADEPTGALDEKRAEEVFGLLRKCAKERLVVLVSHDQALTERYADAVIYMKDGKIFDLKESHLGPKGVPPKSYVLTKKQGGGGVSWAFLFRHAFHLLKAKPWRSLISEAAIATGLCGLGLASYISSSISDELTAAFSSIVPPSAIVMSPRSGGESPIGNIYAASIEECEYIVEEYGDMVRGYGTDFHLDFENWFVDRNDFTFYSGVESARLNDFSIRHINEYRWLDEEVSPMLYPRAPALLYEDQIVLGLPYQHMFQTCLSLHVLRNYQSLGEYIDAHGFEVILHAANYEFGFDDEERFTVVAVMESDVPCIYHFDHHWNHKVFVDQMRFRPSESESTLTPQYAFEIPFLGLRVPSSEFLKLARRDPKISHLVYEPAGESYLKSQCPVGKPCPFRRLYAYGADKSGVSFLTLDECCSAFPSIAGRQPVTAGSYYAEAGSLAMGFIGKFFLCRDLDGAEATVDAYSDLPKESAFLPGQAIEGTLDGSYFAVNEGIRLSSDIASPSNGDPPKSVEECLLSESLYERWGRPKEVYVAAETYAETIGDSYVRHMSIAPLKVCGVKKATHDTFFVVDDWTADFYLQELGMSSFSLEPSGAVFTLREGADAKAVVEGLSKAYGDYSFSNPAEEVAASIASTLGYVGDVLTGFSFIALAMSALLFLIVLAITMSENAGEEALFLAIGLSRKDVKRNYFAHCLLYSGLSTASSLFMLLCSVFFAKFYIGASFHASVSFALPWRPFLVVVAASAGFTFFIMLGISLNQHLKNVKKAFVAQ